MPVAYDERAICGSQVSGTEGKRASIGLNEGGLTDLVVAVDGPGGSRALVFEGPLGALRHEPEVFELPARAVPILFS